MTPRSFFVILIKIIGIYVILTSITVIPQFISTFLFSMGTIGMESAISLTSVIGLLLLTAFCYGVILYYCIFRTDFIIDKLRLDKNFTEEKLDLHIHRSTVLTIAIIVMGGIIFTESLPYLSRAVFTYIQQRGMEFTENSNNAWFIFYAVKAFAGLFMLAKSRLIINFIEQQRKKK